MSTLAQGVCGCVGAELPKWASFGWIGVLNSSRNSEWIIQGKGRCHRPMGGLQCLLPSAYGLEAQLAGCLLRMAASRRTGVHAHDDKENPSLQSTRYCFPCKTDRILKQRVFLSFGEGVCDMDMRANLRNMFRDRFGNFCQHFTCV